jgi:hypothetical protein
MKLSILNSVSALILTSALTAQAGHAAGLSITTTCKSLSPDSRTQVALKVVRAIDYDRQTAKVDAEYQGSMQWDAEPHSSQGNFSAALPVISGRGWPKLPNEFNVSQGAESISLALAKEAGSTTSFTAVRMNLKFKVYSGVLGMGAQYAVLKLALPNDKRGTVSGFGHLYITNGSESSVTTPDGGSEISLVCENQINDL